MSKLTAKEKQQYAAHNPNVVQLIEEMRLEFPDLKIKFKDDFWLYKFLNLFIKDEILYRMSTTLLNAIFMSSRQKAWDNQSWYFRVLAHEFVHLYQFRNPFKLVMTYLAPQIWLLLPIVFLLCLLWWPGYFYFAQIIVTIYGICFLFFPWPSPWRLKAEMEAYTMNLVLYFWLKNKIPEKEIKNRVDIMTGWRYWKMSWLNNKVDKEFRQYAQLVIYTPWLLRDISPAFAVVHRIVLKQNLPNGPVILFPKNPYMN